ncbi:hypothetical protein B0H67DRAFT_138324 [Lasiosphaeris hirsuta]|uniref:Uncharacterized protein n=1 Tax=Lasiosphaeris hirsuta TaxID=260670 RepID=A0AA40B120_9PEZI|nr:hypothetical protein B0H67DRAFT_138324 [Lasiosphaeris hirsuta]
MSVGIDSQSLGPLSTARNRGHAAPAVFPLPAVVTRQNQTVPFHHAGPQEKRRHDTNIGSNRTRLLGMRRCNVNIGKSVSTRVFSFCGTQSLVSATCYRSAKHHPPRGVDTTEDTLTSRTSVQVSHTVYSPLVNKYLAYVVSSTDEKYIRRTQRQTTVAQTPATALNPARYCSAPFCVLPLCLYHVTRQRPFIPFSSVLRRRTT